MVVVVRFVSTGVNAWMLSCRLCIVCSCGLVVVPVRWNGREYRVLYCPCCRVLYVPPHMPSPVYQQAIAAIEKTMPEITVKG